MPELTRRRYRLRREECWHVDYGDVQVGAIARRSGAPIDGPQWEWSCGFYPGTEPGQHSTGTAETLALARAEFGRACEVLFATRTEADFQKRRDAQAFTAWKYTMWNADTKLPTQMASGISRCFCGSRSTSSAPTTMCARCTQK